jgi:hypothetical protein
MRFCRSTIYALVLSLIGVAPLHAGMFGDVLDTLRFAGFAADSAYIDVTNSNVGVIANTLQGNTIDLGDFSFAVAGPVSMVVETGGRRIPEIGLTLSTGQLGINPNRVVTVGAAQPLAYNFNFDTGTNTTNIAGNLLVDLRAKINTYGSYDFRFEASNRQTTNVDGRFEDVPTGNPNFDIGPIDIEGNIFADILANVTDPFFESAGIENIFATFSGRTFREREAKNTIDALKARVDAGGTLTEDELATISALRFVSDFLGDELPNTDFIEQALPTGFSVKSDGTIVPEPATGLMLGGITLLVALRRRRGHR